MLSGSKVRLKWLRFTEEGLRAKRNLPCRSLVCLPIAALQQLLNLLETDVQHFHVAPLYS